MRKKIFAIGSIVIFLFASMASISAIDFNKIQKNEDLADESNFNLNDKT